MPTIEADITAVLRAELPLETDGLLLRAPVMRDATRIASLAGDWDVARYTASIPHPYEESEAAQWVHRAMIALEGPSPGVALMISLKEQPMHTIGRIGLELTQSIRHGEISFWLGQPYWGQGIISEAITGLISFARIKLGVLIFEAAVLPENYAAQAVLHKNGFHKIGIVERDLPARGVQAELLHFQLGGQSSKLEDENRPRRLMPIKRHEEGIISVADLIAGSSGTTPNMPSHSRPTHLDPAVQRRQSKVITQRQVRPPASQQIHPPSVTEPQKAIQSPRIQNDNSRIVLVVAGALIDKDGRVLIAQRPQGKSMAGLWEFPGGKIAAGETPEAALIRELHEELALDISASCLAPLSFASYAYSDFHLLMPVYVCRVWEGTPTAREGQAFAWVRPKMMDSIPMPEADKPIIPVLRDLLL